MKKVFGVAAMLLALAACNKVSETDIQPEEKVQEGTITITATLAPKSAVTRAVADKGDDIITVTWAKDEHIAILYEVNETKYEADATITAVDESGAATITFSVVAGTENDTPCTLIYPYSAAKYDHSGLWDMAILIGTQDGTLKNDLDVRVGEGTIQTTSPGLTVTTQPAPQYAIFKFTTKNEAGSATVDVKPLTITTGAQNFVINPSSATSEFYAALPALTEQAVSFLATGSDGHIYLAGFGEVTFTAGKYYQSTIKMTKHNIIDLSSLSSNVEAQNGDVLTGTLSGNREISIAKDATVTLNGVTIDGYDNPSLAWAGLTCEGNATIILADGTTNTVKGFYELFPGIRVYNGYTLTIKGGGTLNASSNGHGAGIGGGWFYSCGNIEIQSGVINATGGTGAAGIGGGHNAKCGTITISGGSVTATGGVGADANTGAAGIGSGTYENAKCGNISITGGSVTATGGTGAAGIGGGTQATCGEIYIASTMGSLKVTKGSGANYSIGAGNDGTCGTVTVFGATGAISTSPYIHLPGFTVNGSGTQVQFAPGNLQATYDGSSWTWHFAEHQWDFIGNAPGNTTVTGESPYINGPATVDLFGWSTGSTYYGINSAGLNHIDVYNGDFVDWGNRVISGDPNNTWRTLSHGEWEYLLYSRTGARQKYASATVNNVCGLVLLPDVWYLPAGCSFIAGMGGWGRNVYDATQWASMEANGAVFLPAAGYRIERKVVARILGLYWTSTPYIPSGQKGVRVIGFGYLDNDLATDQARHRSEGCSVRLVR